MSNEHLLCVNCGGPVPYEDEHRHKLNWECPDVDWRARCLAAEAKCVAMSELLTWLDKGGGLGSDVHKRIRTALALTATPKEP